MYGVEEEVCQCKSYSFSPQNSSDSGLKYISSHPETRRNSVSSSSIRALKYCVETRRSIKLFR